MPISKICPAPSPAVIFVDIVIILVRSEGLTEEQTEDRKQFVDELTRVVITALAGHSVFLLYRVHAQKRPAQLFVDLGDKTTDWSCEGVKESNSLLWNHVERMILMAFNCY